MLICLMTIIGMTKKISEMKKHHMETMMKLAIGLMMTNRLGAIDNGAFRGFDNFRTEALTDKVGVSETYSIA